MKPSAASCRAVSIPKLVVCPRDNFFEPDRETGRPESLLTLSLITQSLMTLPLMTLSLMTLP